MLKEKTDILQHPAKIVTSGVNLHYLASKNSQDNHKEALYNIKFQILSEMWPKMLLVEFLKISNFLKARHHVHYV